MKNFLRLLINDKPMLLGFIILPLAGAIEYFTADFYAHKILYILSFILIGHDILLNTFRNISKGDVFDENFLMTLASAGAFGLGYYKEAISVMVFYKVGELFQHMAADNATRSIESMLELSVNTCFVKNGEQITEKKPSDVPVGSLIVISPGQKVPLDAVITEGKSDVNTAALTGEAVPVAVAAGDEVFAGYINGNGLITAKTTKMFDETILSKVITLVKESSQKKAKAEKFITKFARYYTPAVVMVAAILAIIPPMVIPGAQRADWIYKALIFLVISCPCALLVSVPLSFYAGIGAAAKKGIFIKGGEYIDILRQVKTIFFDKTGTITTGNFVVDQVVPFSGFTVDEIEKYAAIAEYHSTHPIGQSLVKNYKADLPKISYDTYDQEPGKGISVSFDGTLISIGKPEYLQEMGVVINNPVNATYIAVNSKAAGYFIMMDEIKKDMPQMVDELKKYGVDNLYILSGDHEESVKKVAHHTGMSGYKAALLPEHKLDFLTGKIEDKGQGKVCFIGDGINDAPSLARADVGIAMGAGSDAAIEAADIVLMNDDIHKVTQAIKLSKDTITIAYQNIIGSIGIKFLIMFAGVLGYASLWMAIFGDVGVALIAVLNSMRILGR